MKPLSLALMLVVPLCACSSEPTSPAAANASYVVSGTVVAMGANGLAPIQGVRVVADAPVGTVNAATTSDITDSNGFYSLTLDSGVRSILLTKSGYETGVKTVAVSGDTRFDVQIVARATYTIFGAVSEATPTGKVPVESVAVYCDSCGEFGHAVSYTDATGFYSHTGAYAGVTTLLVTKDGYQASTQDVTVNGETRFDIEIVRAP